MIRILAEHDREQVLGLLAPESALNLFIIGDVENNGFGQEFQQLWGDFEATGRLRAVLLRYYGSFIPYAPGEFELDGLAEVLIGHRDRISTFSGIDSRRTSGSQHSLSWNSAAVTGWPGRRGEGSGGRRSGLVRMMCRAISDSGRRSTG